MSEIVAPEDCTVVRLHGNNGNFKLPHDDVVTVSMVGADGAEAKMKLRAFCRGVATFTCTPGDRVTKDDVLCVLNPCQHDIVFSDICGLCSAVIEIKNMGNGNIKCNTGSRMAMVHANKNLVVNERTAMEMALKDSINLLKKRKLSLLIDLDLTILHTSNFPVSPDLKDVFSYVLKDDRNCESLTHHTKMRPYLKQFLESMHTKFELHIYTFGNRSYADKIREFIDPDKKLFGQRIISRDDSFDMQKKTANLKSLFPRGDNMVCIIDDRPEVWNNAPNFIHVKPYIYFPNADDINNPTEKTDDKTKRGVMGYPSKEMHNKKDSKDSDPKATDSETIVESNQSIPSGTLPDDDDYLLTLENILTEIHNRFYTKYDILLKKRSSVEIIERNILPDVKLIMKEMKSEVLKGCRISFSGLIPSDKKVKETQAYQILRNLGATYYQNVFLPPIESTKEEEKDISKRCTTHLICHSEGTEKMKEVCSYIKAINKVINHQPDKLSTSIHRVDLVNIYWLWHCYFLWSRVDESQFLFSSNFKQLAPPEGVVEVYYDDSVSQHSSNSGCHKRQHVDDEEASTSTKRIRIEDYDDFMKEFIEEDDSILDLSKDSHGSESEDSNDDEWIDDNVMLHYTPEQQLEMLKEVNEAMDEEKLEKRTSQSSDFLKSDDDSSSSNEDNNDSEQEEPRIKNPPKNWENGDKEENISSSEDSSGEQEWDYGHFENNCKKFGTSIESDSEGGSDDDL